MYRILIAFLVFTAQSECFAQVESDSAHKTGLICMEKIDTSDAPVFILMLDNEEIIFEYQDIQGFEPDHIKKIIVSKDNKDLEKYNTDVGIVCIYPKRRYRKLFRKEFVSEEIKNGT